MEVLVETSARHVHLSQEALEALFGAGATLTKKKDLSQPGQYSCEERVTIVGPKKEIPNVSVLGPTRPQTQIELSATDARGAGFAIAVRESGDIDGSPACTLKGPNGTYDVDSGVIVAKRHVHLTETSAAAAKLHNGDLVGVKILSDGRSAVLGDVVIRVSDKFGDAMHIDTDESNAVSCGAGQKGAIVANPSAYI
ncbi:phosphate propanoyltransferase [Clostridia bacterium]|nr:phosphate propanoyltransferase [Clostridia bacterium]